MLIYNYQKEFLGIDEADLKALGFSNFSQLRAESADFADLFVKTPGYVHNFKHVHWIDFVTCAEGSEDSKVIIHANGKNFRCTIDIKTAFLVDDPTQKAYIVNLINLRALTHGENEQVAGDVLEKPAPRASTETTAIFDTPEFSGKFHDDKDETKGSEQEEHEVTHDPYEMSKADTLDELESSSQVVEDIYEDAPIDLGDELLDIEENIEPEVPQEIIQEEEEEAQEVESIPVVLTQVLNVGPNYVYDPHLASDELGLPVDLIEEFIQDFISQAAEFKDDLYSSLHEGDTDNVKILSHKLKGVAANLRIEDAFEVLTTINTSDDTDEIKTNMDTFYVIIEKLSGKTFEKSEVAPEGVQNDFANDEDDDLILSFKDESDKKETIEEEIQIEMPIEDSDVPQKIEMSELADDDFITLDEIETTSPEEDNTTNIDELEEFKNDESAIEIDMPDESNLVEDNYKEDSQNHYDKNVAASEIGIDSQSFNELFKDYITEGEKACASINESIEQNNSDAWRQGAIKLKGMSDNMRIHDFTSELESIIHTQDSNEAKEAIDTISSILQQISSREV